MRLRLPLAAMVYATTLAALPQAPAAAQNKTPAPPSAKSAAPGPSEPAAAQSAAIAQRVESFLREVYAWGPAYQLKVGPLSPAPAGDLYAVPVQVTAQGQTDSTTVYMSKDGRYMFRGDIQDLNQDPLAAIRDQIKPNGAASKGPKDAKVVLVEYGDFECPVCRQLDQVFRDLLPKYPQVRLVFKDFPLEEIHPWALTAAIAGRCVLRQSEDAFWKFHDAVYDNQDLISPENAYSKLTELATQAGASATDLQACMADPKTTDEVRQTQAEGRAIQVDSTPTTFVDGRRIVGPDEPLLQQYIDFDLAAAIAAGR